MRLLVYTKLFREKFQKEIFLCENDLLLCVLSGAFEVRLGESWVRVDENQAFHFFKDRQYERRILAPMTMALFRYQSHLPLFPTEHVVFKDTERVRSTLALAEAGGIFPDATARRAHLLADLKNQYETERRGARLCARAEDAEILMAERKIRDGLAGALSVAVLAEECALSHVQFIRRFRSAFGRTPSEHIASLRLERAKALLTQTALPIKKISKQCGFENEYYFSNFFKKHTALSPSEYRQMTA